ncbi:MAG TPA: TetR/AcrR family transcriptional regulator [Acidobacteriota bacterium]|nr:TetR/AcrR family transcriptional regulator [Acidobacteriota bacterium]
MQQGAAQNKIRQAAEEAFFRDGIRAVTMDELARRLGMSKRTLYQHFDSKRALLREVLLGRTRHIDQVLRDATARQYGDFAEKLRVVLKRLAQALPQPSQRFFRDLRGGAPEVWQELVQERERILSSHFRRLLQEGRQQHALREDLSTDLILRIFLSMVQGLITPQVLAELPLSAGQVLDRIVAVLMTGILTPGRDGKGEKRQLTGENDA